MYIIIALQNLHHEHTPLKVKFHQAGMDPLDKESLVKQQVHQDGMDPPPLWTSSTAHHPDNPH